MQSLSSQKLMPVILLGAGRSGTKFLRAVLESSSEAAAIPYDVGYVWRYGNEEVEHDQLTTDMLDERTRAYVRKTLPQLADSHLKPQAKFLIEKSVPNTLRVEFIHKIYPEAKFIHLIRDGRAVTESSMRMWREPPDRSYLLKKIKYFPWSNYRYAWWYFKNVVKGKLASERGQQIWGPRYIGMDIDAATLPLVQVCTKQWKNCVEICLDQLKSIPAENVLEVRYENLMRNTGEIEKICDFIGLSDKATVVEYFTSHVQKNHTESWKSRLSSNDIDIINNETGELLARLGYAPNQT